MFNKANNILISFLCLVIVSCSTADSRTNNKGVGQFSDKTFDKLTQEHASLRSNIEKQMPDDNRSELLSEIDSLIDSQLKQGKFLSGNTASSNNQYYLMASRLLEYLKDISKSKAKLKQRVETRISFKPTLNYIMQYMTFEEYKNGITLWKSYNYGMVLPTKTYIFKVYNEERKYIEPVVIWDDPQELTINMSGRRN